MRSILSFASALLLVTALAAATGCSTKSNPGVSVTDNYSLSNLSVSDGITLSPAFSSSITEYTAAVAQELTQCSVTAYAGHEDQSLEINGSSVDSGEAFTIVLSQDETIVKIKVTSGSGTWQRYNLTLARNTVSPSNDARLSALTAQNGSVLPFSGTFSPDTFSYTCNIANSVASATIKAVPVNASASITVDGTALASGTESASFAVDAGGSRTITVVVIAEDGVTTKEYSVTINRAGELSNDSLLSALTLSSNASWTPLFDAHKYSYAITVENQVSSITITPTLSDTGKASVTVAGTPVTDGTASESIGLEAGKETQISVVVTAEDGVTASTYLLKITRPALNDNSYLSSLSLGDVAISPAFVNTTTGYTATVTSAASSITVVAGLADNTAKMTINGNETASGAAAEVALNTSLSSNQITITVTAGSGKTTTYIITVTITPTLCIYFEKPAAWSAAWIWYDAGSDGVWETKTVATAPGDMTLYRTEGGLSWYKKDLGEISSAAFLFNSGTWANKLQSDGFNKSPGVNFSAAKTVWVRADGTVTAYDPITPAAPVISVTPAGGTFSSTTCSVTVSIASSQTVTEMSYSLTLNNGSPVTTTLTSQDAIVNVAAGTTQTGDIVKLQVTALNATGRTTTDQYTFTRTEAVTAKLGANYTSSATTFAIWSPDSSDVVLTLDGVNKTCTKMADFDGYTGVYGCTVTGDQKLKEYTFKIAGKAVCDPYGVMVKAGTTTNIVMDLDSTDPVGGWVSRPTLKEREDSVIYEVHIRDFTLDTSSGVDSAKRGKYLGMVQSGTTYTSGASTVKTGIDHLVELGVTHVQIMPFYDFASAMYNWGYDPVNYNVPEEQFASSATDYAARIQEVKTMVNELHKKGIRVIMDVVYNHTYDNSPFTNISSRYYYTDARKDFAGCGVALNCGEPMVSRFIQDSMDYWASEFQIDGFRMDLMGIFYYSCVNDWADSLNAKNPGANILLYGEPWNGYYQGADAESSQRVRLGKAPLMGTHHAGVFSSKFREAIKGDNDSTGKGYMFNTIPSWTGQISAGVKGSILATKSTSALADDWDSMFAYDPEQSVNYISAHDNFCLWDKIKKCSFDNAYGKRVDKFGMGIVFTSQGIPFMHGGDEMLRTKVYNSDWTYAHNSYNAPDNYNKYDWSWKSANSEVYDYYRNMIAIRRAHPGFRMTTWDMINSNVTSTTANSGQVVITSITGSANSDSWSKTLVIYNSGSDYTYSLSGSWKIAAQDENAAVGGTAVSGSIVCKGTSVTILYQ